MLRGSWPWSSFGGGRTRAPAEPTHPQADRAAGLPARSRLPSPLFLVNPAPALPTQPANPAIESIQSQIDLCHALGGGEVVIPPGRHVTGGLQLRSNVFLRLAPGATLVGSDSLRDYPANDLFVDAVGGERGHALIFARDADNIGITGEGTLDGNGLAFAGARHRPMLLRFVRCTRLRIRDIALQNSAAWVQHYLDCEDVALEGLTVNSTACSNNDGINLDGCRRVTVANCRITSGDDAITLKTTTPATCRDIAIMNCTLRSRCNGIKIGTESRADFRNITITNCALHDVRLCGIELLSVDGGEIDTVNISNITMDRVGGAFFLRLGQRGLNEPLARPGALRNVSLTNLTAFIHDDLLPETIHPAWEVAHGARSPSSLMGLPGHPIENVFLGNIAIHHIGTGTAADAAQTVEEKPAEYPQWERWGPLPAWGLYVRHARNVIGRDLRFSLQAPDARPCIHAEDAPGLNVQGLPPWPGEEKSCSEGPPANRRPPASDRPSIAIATAGNSP